MQWGRKVRNKLSESLLFQKTPGHFEDNFQFLNCIISQRVGKKLLLPILFACEVTIW